MVLTFKGGQTEKVFSAEMNNMAFMAFNGIISGCLVSPKSPATMQVDIVSGRIFFGANIVDVNVGTLTIDGNTAINNRLDLIVVDRTGTISIVKGVPAVLPATPNYNPNQYVVLAIITVTPSITEIMSDNIKDIRVLNTVRHGGSSGSMGRRFSPFTNETSVSFRHDLADSSPMVIVYDNNNNVIIPENIVSTDDNTTTVTFSESTSGTIVVYGGVGRANSYYSRDFSSATTWTVTHNLGQKYVQVQCYDSSDVYIKDSAITSITLTNENSCTIVFPSATAGRVVVTGGASSPDFGLAAEITVDAIVSSQPIADLLTGAKISETEFNVKINTINTHDFGLQNAQHIKALVLPIGYEFSAAWYVDDNLGEVIITTVGGRHVAYVGDPNNFNFSFNNIFAFYVVKS